LSQSQIKFGRIQVSLPQPKLGRIQPSQLRSKFGRVDPSPNLAELVLVQIWLYLVETAPKSGLFGRVSRD